MAGRTVDIDSILQKDNLGCEIAKLQYSWNMLRAPWISEVQEIRQFIYATNTKNTSAGKLPWRNTTCIPKLCQVRDNLNANYLASLMPKRKWVHWHADDKSSNTEEKRNAISSFMCYTIEQGKFKQELSKCVLDYIDYGNAFAMAEWVDERVDGTETGVTKVGYVGPSIRRISPLDIVFNPIAPDWDSTPKIVRSIVSMGEVKKLLQSLTNDENRDAYEKLYQYLRDVRKQVQGFGGELLVKDEFLRVDGFTNYQLYLQSNYCELLTFYGDIYDPETDEFLENQTIIVVDRHKVISKKTNPSYFGKSPIYHVGWRERQDNLWAMSPLANLVGMQYRVDHLENIKADVMDLIAFPVLKIKGYVDNFEWKPMARIHIGDNDGDVEMLMPPFQVLQIDQEIMYLLNLMEEMAGAPKEAMGFRTPGEKTKYEVQRQENAASRIFQHRTGQFEQFFVEPLLNGMLEQQKRKGTSDILVKYFDSDLKIQKFLNLSADDISGNGRIKPFAARHFAEQAEMVQNLTTLFSGQSGLGQMIAPHYSTIKLAQMFEDLFDIQDYHVVLPFVQLAEQADAQRISQAVQEQVLLEALTPAGLSPEDTNLPFTVGTPGGQQPAVPSLMGQNGPPMDQGNVSGAPGGVPQNPY